MAKPKRRIKPTTADDNTGEIHMRPQESEIQLGPQDLQLIIGEQQVMLRVMQSRLEQAQGRIQELETEIRKPDDSEHGNNDEGGEDGDA